MRLSGQSGNPKLKHYKVTGITANAFESDRNKLLEAGMDDIVLKPFRKDELYDKMAQILPG